MSKLPVLSGRKIIKILKAHGFEIVGTKGSHVRLKKKTEEKVFITVVPLHRELAPGTFLDILKQTGLSREDFTK